MQIPDVPPQLLAALVKAAAGQRLALVGGVVRDLLLHRHHQDHWRGLPDLDLVVQGSAADLVARLPAALEQQFHSAITLRQQPHDRYGTVELELQLPQEYGGRWLVDLASARREQYPTPAGRPKVFPCTLEEDLGRRDFTVNAMALELLGGSTNDLLLIDPYGGLNDLEFRELRFLHQKSLIDDPTRLVRAARYASRLNLRFSTETLAHISSILYQWPWNWRCCDAPSEAPCSLSTRLGREFELLLLDDSWQNSLASLQDWGGLCLLDYHLDSYPDLIPSMCLAQKLGIPLYLSLVANAENPLLLASRLLLPERQQRLLFKMNLLEYALKSISSLTTAATVCELIESNSKDPRVSSLLIVAGSQHKDLLLKWLNNWRFLRSPVSSQELISQGWAPGPELGIELQRQRMLLLEQINV